MFVVAVLLGTRGIQLQFGFELPLQILTAYSEPQDPAPPGACSPGSGPRPCQVTPSKCRALRAPRFPSLFMGLPFQGGCDPEILLL